MNVHYLEIVAEDAAAHCRLLEALHSVTFSEPVAELGGAKVAQMSDGAQVGVREPMHETERPCVRPYYLTKDIEGAIKKVEGLGAVIAHAPMEIPGRGSFAIYILNGIMEGLWQL